MSRTGQTWELPDGDVLLVLNETEVSRRGFVDVVPRRVWRCLVLANGIDDTWRPGTLVKAWEQREWEDPTTDYKRIA